MRKRLAVYAEQTAPLLGYYRGRGLLARVSGEGAVDTIRSAIRRAASVRPRPADKVGP